MAAVGLAIVGKDNTPLYVREFLSPHDPHDGGDDEAGALFGLKPLPSGGKRSSSERFWFVLHAALDRLEQLSLSLDGKKKVLPHHSFVGLLLPLEETRVYGYQTNTHIKFLLIVEDEGPSAGETIAADVQQLMEELHELYVGEVMNPFKTNDTADTASNRLSRKFDERVQKQIASFNQTGIEI